MSRLRKSSIVFGLCTNFAACDDAFTPDPTPTPPAATLDAVVQSLSDNWAAKRSLPPNRTGMVAATVSGRIYVAGGEHTDWVNLRTRLLSRVDAYHVATKTWSQVASMPGARYDANGASVINDRIYVTGGLNNLFTPQDQRKPTRTLFVYDPASDTWTRKADMPQPGCSGVQGILAGKLYVYMPPLRACDPFAAGSVARFYRYDPATDSWVQRAVPPGASRGGAGGVISGKFYLTAQGAQLQVYDPASNAWTMRAPMPQARSGAIDAVLNGRLYLVGGSEPASEWPRPVLQVYDAGTDTWAVKTPPPIGTVGGAAAGAGGKVYYVAGRVFLAPGGVERLPEASEVYAYTP